MLNNARPIVRVPAAPVPMPPGGRAARAGIQGSIRLVVVVVLLFALSCSPNLSSAQPSTRVAVLDIELLQADYLPDAKRITPEERRRLDIVAELIRDRLRTEGFDAVSADATRSAIVAADPGQYLHQCNGCERAIARALEADWVAVGWIQMVSYLIINLNVVVLDVESGIPVGYAFVDLRGNTERSWRRATTYLLDNILVERLLGGA